MSKDRGVLLLTVSPEVADRIDWIGEATKLSQEEVISAAIAILSGGLQERDERILRFVAMVIENKFMQRGNLSRLVESVS